MPHLYIINFQFGLYCLTFFVYFKPNSMQTVIKHIYWHALKIIFLILFFFAGKAVAQNFDGQTELRSYLQKELLLPENIVQTVYVSRAYDDAFTGIKHIYANQKINGLTITQANFALHVSDVKKININQLLDFKEWNVKPLNVSVPATAAIVKAMDEINYTESREVKIKSGPEGKDQTTVYKRNESSIWDIPVRLVYYKEIITKQLIPSWELLKEIFPN